MVCHTNTWFKSKIYFTFCWFYIANGEVDEAILLADRVVMMTNGPQARIGKIMSVSLPRPRTRADLLTHPRYYEYRAELISFLEEYERGHPGVQRSA
ncbi:hypothetical protein WCLP8_4340013 [uncultured Gammaproteobacteria bacterium]